MKSTKTKQSQTLEVGTPDHAAQLQDAQEQIAEIADDRIHLHQHIQEVLDQLTNEEKTLLLRILQNDERQRTEAQLAEESDHLFENHIQKVCDTILGFTPMYQKRILLKVLNDISHVTARVEKLATMEERIRDIYNGLDLKTKFLITTLNELAAVGTVANEIKYGDDIMDKLSFSFAGNIVHQVRESEFSQDPNITYLCDAFELAAYINQVS